MGKEKSGALLRRKALELALENFHFVWTPSRTESFFTISKGQKTTRVFEKGALYRGIPSANARGSLAAWGLFTQNGVLSPLPDGWEHILCFGEDALFNQCWGEVCSDLDKLNGIGSFCPPCGIFPDGDFEMNITGDRISSTKEIADQNGKEKMLAAYAGAGLASAFILRTDKGVHGYMLRENLPVFGESGKVDPEKSRAVFLCANGARGEAVLPDGRTVTTLGMENLTMSYEELFNEGFLPVAPPEFLDRKEPAEWTASLSNRDFSKTERALTGNVSSNFAIRYIKLEFLHENGEKQVFYGFPAPGEVCSMPLTSVHFDPSRLAPGNYRYRILLFGKSEEHLLYEGDLPYGAGCSFLPEVPVRYKKKEYHSAYGITDTEKIRDFVVAAMEEITSFIWTPDRNLPYHSYIGTGLKDFCLRYGDIISGFPYTWGSSSLFPWLEHYDEETGCIKNLPEDWQEHFGINCSTFVQWSWARVSSTISIKRYYYTNMDRGVLPVGGYRVDPKLDLSRQGITICEREGEQGMYRAYAAAKRADVLITSKIGHCMPIYRDPVVVYNEDGTINGEESFFILLHQVSTWQNETLPDGAVVRHQAKKNDKLPFSYFYHNRYIPVTCAELAGTKPVEKPYVRVENGVVISNYRIAFLRCDVFQHGELLERRYVYDGDEDNFYHLSLVRLQNSEKDLPKGFFRKVLTVCIATGEMFEISSEKVQILGCNYN